MLSLSDQIRVRGPLLLGLTLAAGGLNAQPAVPVFTQEVSVHDPSIVRAPDGYYVFGSHLASARSADLMAWTQLSSSPVAGNPLAADPAAAFAPAVAWIGGTLNFWAPDVHRLASGKYALFYSLCEGDSPRGVIGLASADAPGGPYADQGSLIKSGMWGEISPDGTVYDATRHPNAVDPDVFADAQGNLWMVYGSYSGGIFILRLDAATGRPLTGQGYGKKLAGGNHARIEGPCILHNPATGYYYLFLSFGGLTPDGGYQVRVARSTNPDGPYFDPAGVNMTHVGGPAGSFFDDAAIAPYGAKLIGNYQFNHIPGEPGASARGYLSPGHNSVYRDAATGLAYFVFHTRFVGRGNAHEVRVHRLYFNAQAWPVVAPQRYAGEVDPVLDAAQIPGRYKLVNHGKDISPDLHTSSLITLVADGTVTGDASGAWTIEAGNVATLTLQRIVYRGVFTRQWDDDNRVWVRAFTALSAGGVTVWGSEVATPNAPPVLGPQSNAAAVRGETWRRTVYASDGDYAQSVTYSLKEAPAAAEINSFTGEINWTPSLAEVGKLHRFTVRATDNGAAPRYTEASFEVAVSSRTVLRRVELDFTATGSSGLRDGAGRFTGLTARLPGTGGGVPINDPLLSLMTAGTGGLALTTTQSDYNGSTGLTGNRSIGLALAELGFTGAEDFAVTARFAPLPRLGLVDQVGLFVGTSGTMLTRAGAIVFGSAPEGYAVHTRAGADKDGHFKGVLDPTDGLTVCIQRASGAWGYWVDDAEWPPLTSGVASEPVFLNNTAGLCAGVFAITPLNATPKTVMLESLMAVVDTGLTPLETWRGRYFENAASAGAGADTADPDSDGLPNLLEYALGGDPVGGDGGERPQVGVAGGMRLTLSFTRIAEASLTYLVEAADTVGGPWVTIWTSTGAANTAGRVTVTDTMALTTSGTTRFLRLRVAR